MYIDSDLQMSFEESPWKIKNDGEAERLIEKQADKLIEVRRLKSSIKNKIVAMEERLKKVEDEEKSIIEHRNHYLRQYFEVLEEDQKIGAKTQTKYRLPSVDLIMKKPTEEYVRDDKKLVEWLEKNKMDKYLVTESRPRWGVLKKDTVTNGNVRVTVDGEIVDGVSVRMTEPEFKVVE